jgi:hypothetical protein
MRWRIFLAFLLMLASYARAHTLIENSMEVVVWPDKITIDARISLEEVIVAGALEEREGKLPQAELMKGLEGHGRYVLDHLKVLADEALLKGTVKGFDAPPAAFSGLSRSQAERQFAVYHLEFGPAAKAIHLVRIEQDLLQEFNNVRGGWQVGFAVRIRQCTDTEFVDCHLSWSDAAEYLCDWSATSARPAVRTRPRNIFRAYLRFGVEHIFPRGYDHLLFVMALVLGATRLWDLVKIVTAFTLAHTITLTVSVLGWFSLPSHIVEPVIAASIVFVAVQNVFWPRTSRGWMRLGVAFGFGLFHGLGFAGDIRDSMSAMGGMSLALALVGFSLGVEMGHQFVVLPMFGAMKLARSWKEEAMCAFLMRWGSAAIAIGGVIFLVDAMRG